MGRKIKCKNVVSVCNIKTSKYLEDSKFKQIPVVNVERCNFEEFFHKSPSKGSSETNCEMRNSQYSELPQGLIVKCLSKRVNNRQKRNTNVKTNNTKPDISVRFRKCVDFAQEELHTKNDRMYEAKRKRDNVNNNTKGVDFRMQQKTVDNEHKVLECFNVLKNINVKLRSKPQSNEKVLRPKKKVNYKEKLSIGTPEINTNPVHPEGARIPIYKQFHIINTSSNEGKHDQYDFILDSDEEKGSDFSFHVETPAKKRKVAKMLHIPKRRVNNKQNHLMKSKKDDTVKYEDKIQNIMHNIQNKINVKNDTNGNPSNQILINQDSQKKKNHLFINNIKNPIINVELIFNSTPGRETHNISLPNESPIPNNKGRAKSNVNVKENILIQRDLNKKFLKVATSNRQIISSHKKSIPHHQYYSKEGNINLDESESIDRNVEFLNSSGSAVKTSNALSGNSSPASNFATDICEASDYIDNLRQYVTSENRALVSNERNNLDDLFGFLEDIEEENKERTPIKGRINIIQNIELTKSSISNPIMWSKEQPTRNSWRFNDYSTRNPHFLQLKSDGLPSLNQEPVLNHTFDDRISDVNTTLVPHSRKSLKQRSILNFVETSIKHFDENLRRPSLYDVEEYSPIKVNPVDKENSESNRVQLIKHTTRRNVLGEINENIMAGKTSTPAKSKKPPVPMQIDVSLIEHEKENDVEITKNFGFNSSSEIVENVKIKAGADNHAKPFRLEVNFKRSKPTKNLPEKHILPVRDSEVRKLVDVGNDPEFSKLIENEGLECDKVGLFEDPDMSQNITKCYKARTKKKIVATQDNPRKKDKECKLSKEAKKWIKEFNQMCDEVENVELELD